MCSRRCAGNEGGQTYFEALLSSSKDRKVSIKAERQAESLPFCPYLRTPSPGYLLLPLRLPTEVRVQNADRGIWNAKSFKLQRTFGAVPVRHLCGASGQ